MRRSSEACVVYLGSSVITEAMEQRHVEVRTDNPLAMVEAVRNEEIDLVVHFASWPETFSFTTYEALSGGAGVLTNPVSGNVAAMVKETELGAVLEDQDALLAFLKSAKAEELVQKIRKHRSELQPDYKLSEMTIPHLSGSFVQ